MQKLCRMQLQKALKLAEETDASNVVAQEQALKAAIMSCKQHRQTDLAEFSTAQGLLEGIVQERMKKQLSDRLKHAVLFKDINMLVGVVSEGQRICQYNGISESAVPQIAEAQNAMRDIMGKLILEAVIRENEDELRRVGR